MIGHLNAWNKALNYVNPPLFDFVNGDTIVLKSELKLLIKPLDSKTPIKLYPKDFITLKPGNVLEFIEPSNYSPERSDAEVKVNFEGHMYRRILFTKELLDSQYGEEHMNKERTFLIKEFLNFKSSRLRFLSKKYGVSEDSIISISKSNIINELIIMKNFLSTFHNKIFE